MENNTIWIVRSIRWLNKSVIRPKTGEHRSNHMGRGSPKKRKEKVYFKPWTRSGSPKWTLNSKSRSFVSWTLNCLADREKKDPSRKYLLPHWFDGPACHIHPLPRYISSTKSKKERYTGTIGGAPTIVFLFPSLPWPALLQRLASPLAFAACMRVRRAFRGEEGGTSGAGGACGKHLPTNARCRESNQRPSAKPP
jgi:hypothetical protein